MEVVGVGAAVVVVKTAVELILSQLAHFRELG